MNADVRRDLAEIGRAFHARGWALGTSGNFSAVTRREPLRLAITRSSVDKGALGPDDVIEVDGEGLAVGELARGRGAPAEPAVRPSDEVLLHLAVVRARGAGAVLHTHSVWGTLLSDEHAAAGGLAIEGYEMLKGLAGVATHEHKAFLPIVDNASDARALAGGVGRVLERHRDAHGFLIRRHGLYTWGADLTAAKRHVEVLEFLLEAVGRAARRGGA
jgi:methylthioribulose-1-phosphate dehydratase